MSNKEFELKFLPTKACLELRLNQEFATDSDYVFAFFTEGTEEIPYRKQTLDGDRYLWENTSKDFQLLATGNSIAAQVEFSGFPEIETNTNSPQKVAATISDYISFQVNSDKVRDIPNDAKGVFLTSGSNVMYAGERHPETIEMWPVIDFFTHTEAIFWTSIYLGAFASDPQLIEAIATGTGDTGFLNLSNSDTWLLVNSEVELLNISTNVGLNYDDQSKASFEDIILEKSETNAAVLGGLFLSNGTSTDDVILYASPFYSDRKTENIEIESVLAVSADFFTDIIII